MKTVRMSVVDYPRQEAARVLEECMLDKQDKEPTEVIITGVEIPIDDLAWLVAKTIVVVVVVSVPVYLIGLAAFVLLTFLLSLVT